MTTHIISLFRHRQERRVRYFTKDIPLERSPRSVAKDIRFTGSIESSAFEDSTEGKYLVINRIFQQGRLCTLAAMHKSELGPLYFSVALGRARVYHRSLEDPKEEVVTYIGPEEYGSLVSYLNRASPRIPARMLKELQEDLCNILPRSSFYRI